MMAIIGKEEAMTEIRDLRQYELFGSLSDQQLAALAKSTERRTYRKHSHVYERGDPAVHAFLLTKGLVSLRDIGPGDLIGISYETCEPGQLMGTASLLRAPEYPLTAVCLEDSEVVAIESNGLHELCRNDPRLGYNLMFTIAQLYFGRYQQAKKQVYAMIQAPTIITALPG